MRELAVPIGIGMLVGGSAAFGLGAVFMVVGALLAAWALFWPWAEEEAPVPGLQEPDGGRRGD